MIINGIEVTAARFAYDGCHKIYILETDADELDAQVKGYEILPMSELQDAYDNSCGLRFISNWALTEQYAEQFEEAEFDEDK